jgi:predicted nucleotide-binding protein
MESFMQKTKEYKNTIFSVETIKKAIVTFDELVKAEVIRGEKFLFPDWGKKFSDEDIFEKFSTERTMSIQTEEETWSYDSEDEYFADYRKYISSQTLKHFSYSKTHSGQSLDLSSELITNSEISVRINSHPDNRAIIEKVFDIFETDAPKSKLPYESVNKPKIFIGHGRSTLWRDLKDHLHDKQRLEIVAYEVGARAGHTIRDILVDMLSESSFALLVMTAEDETADGQFRARQNVIHEIGLFQGRLGFNRAIILLEEGTEEFSNISGIDQIRFAKGNIKETYGEILATIKREFY